MVSATSSSSSSTTPVSRYRVEESEDPQLQLARRSVARVNPDQTFDIILPQILARSARAEKSIELFYDYYVPKDRQGSRNLQTNGFASVLPLLYVHDDALRIALLALSSAATGQEQGDPWMLQYGQKLYGRALQELAAAVRDPRRANTEALLAVPRIMGLFEIVFGADSDQNIQARSWRSHAEGEWAIMKARGPSAHASGAGHQLFIDGRYNPIIAAIRMRKATILNSPAWKSEPWSESTKTPKDTLLDILAGIPEILQYLDFFKEQPSVADTKRLRKVILTQCSILEKDLVKWTADNSDKVYTPPTEDPIPIQFPTYSMAHLTAMYWATSTLVYQCIELANAPFPSAAPKDQPPRSPKPAPTGSFSSIFGSTFNDDPTKSSHHYARRITRSVSYFFAPERGIFGATIIAFPVGVSFMNLNGKEQERPYLGLAMQALTSPNLPSAVGKFLTSMGREGAGKWGKVC